LNSTRLSAAVLIAGLMTIFARVPLNAQSALTAAPAPVIEQTSADPSATDPSANEVSAADPSAAESSVTGPSAAESSVAAPFWVSGYVASWTLNMGDGSGGNMPYQNLDLSAMTHVIMFAAAIGSDGSVTYNSMVASRRKTFNDYVHSKGKPILMSIGGAGNTAFSTAMGSGRTNLVKNLLNSIRTERYDGIDIDIEPLSSADAPNVRLFVKQLYDSLSTMRAYYDASKRPIITAAVYNSQSLWAELSPYIDQVNVMTYDYFGDWFGKSWHNNAPYGAAGDVDVGGTAMTTVENKAQRYFSAGMPTQKLGVGVDFNGYIWKGGMLSDGNGVTAPRQRWSSAPTQQGGEIAGWQIVRDWAEKYPSSVHFDNTSKVPYVGVDNAGNANDYYVTYQDATTAKEIVKLAKSKGMGGVILWEIGGGYFGPSQFPTRAVRDPLLQAVKQEAFGGSAPPPLPSTDLTPPVVSVTGPIAGARVSGTVTITASATDNVGVTSVQFLLNGTALGAAVTAAPYSRSWNTTTGANGSYEISAIARDGSNNTATSKVTVTVSNAAPPPPSDLILPVVSVTSPLAGARISGTVNVTATASDNVGVASVQFLLNGTALGAALTAAPYSRSWNTAAGSNGSYEITAVARDAAGNTASSKVTVTVSNTVPVGGDLIPPAVSVTGPAGGATIGGTVNLTATASDNVGVTSVQFLLNGTAFGAALTAAPYTRSWNTSAGSDGSYEVTAVARDAAGNTASAKVSVTVSNASSGDQDLAVFGDELSKPWIKTPWSAVVTVGSTEQAYTGASSIKVEQGTWGSMSVHSGSWWQSVPIATSMYSSVQFAVYGGASGADIAVMFENDAEEAFPTVGGGFVSAGTWEVITVPMSKLNPSKLTVHRLDIMEKSGSPTTYYVDDIRFVAAPLPSAAAKTAGTEEVLEVPATFALSQNYPNPFNPSTTISYDLAGESEVTLEVFNALGQSVSSIASGVQQAGRYQTRFDASNLAGGVYFYRLTAVPKEANGSAPFVEMKKMILVK
jgi:GH18 family chitinase